MPTPITYLLGFALWGLVFWTMYKVFQLVAKIRNSILHPKLRENDTSDQARVQALQELEDNTMDKLLWAKAIEQSDGNMDKAKSIYIHLRAKYAKPNGKQEQRE